MRAVFDCADKVQGTSLNDKLVTAPDLMNSLIGVLIRFRESPIALVGDVEQMFHHVYVSPEHRNALRFLWWPGGNLDEHPVPHQMTVYIFGSRSSPSCANFCLRHTAIEFSKHYEPAIAEIVNKNFYVNDCLVSFPSVEARRSLRELLTKRGFRLRKWLSNSQDVLKTIPGADR